MHVYEHGLHRDIRLNDDDDSAADAVMGQQKMDKTMTCRFCSLADVAVLLCYLFTITYS